MVVVSVLLIALAGCGSKADSRACDFGDGACAFGAFYATCSATPETSVFACNGGECAWIQGCVPEGYRASPCPADDLCCFDDWPFDEWNDWDPVIAEHLYAWGTRPWDAERETNIAVDWRTDAPLADPAAVRCTGTATFDRTPCGRVPDVEHVHDDGAHTVYLRGGGEWDIADGWYLLLEVREGDPAARVCQLRMTDGVPTSCFFAADPACAVSGTAQLRVVDGALRGLIEGTFADGLVVSIEL